MSSSQKISSDALLVSLMARDSALAHEEKSILEELMSRALLQNPDLAEKLHRVQNAHEDVKSLRQAETINLYHEWLRKQEAERMSNRKITYDDKRNVNALHGMRRSAIYQMSSRLEQIEMELKKYYNPRAIEPPKELIRELRRLKSKNLAKAG